MSVTDEAPATAHTQEQGIDADLFYHGTIHRVFPRKNAGIVRTSSGRELPFSFQLLDLIGPVKRPQELREGLVVGYDMGWTSDGLKVTKIKTYRRVGEEQTEREPGSRTDTAVERDSGATPLDNDE